MSDYDTDILTWSEHQTDLLRPLTLVRLMLDGLEEQAVKMRDRPVSVSDPPRFAARSTTR